MKFFKPVIVLTILTVTLKLSSGCKKWKREAFSGGKREALGGGKQEALGGVKREALGGGKREAFG